jgi:hypothetical protein
VYALSLIIIAFIANIGTYFNKVELEYQRDDSLHPSGGACLSVFDAIVEFDNVVITGDDIPNVGPSGYAVEPEAKLSTT